MTCPSDIAGTVLITKCGTLTLADASVETIYQYGAQPRKSTTSLLPDAYPWTVPLQTLCPHPRQLHTLLKNRMAKEKDRRGRGSRHQTEEPIHSVRPVHHTGAEMTTPATSAPNKHPPSILLLNSVSHVPPTSFTA